MPTNESAPPIPTRAQAEKMVNALLEDAAEGENLVTRLKVTSYVAWRARFDEMKDAHASAGIANARLFYDARSENTVVVLADISDSGKAPAWAQGGWRTAIPADDVEGSPSIYVANDTDQDAAAAKLSAHFRVYDYPKWHELFIKMEGSRVASGITNPTIFRGSEDGNDVLVLWDIASAARARAWMVEDFMTGYPSATGAVHSIVRFLSGV